MSIIPRKLSDLVNWVASHAPAWAVEPTSIGLSAEQVASLQSELTMVQGNIVTRDSAVNTARAAVQTTSNNASAMRKTASDLVRTIKAFAQTQAKPEEIYAMAQIPAPASPSPVPPPGMPTDFRASLNPEGSLTITWKCANPAGAGGTVYNVRRRFNSSSPWQQLGATGIRSFTDETLSGTTSVMYQVQAQRSASFGLASLTFMVQFGTGGGGFMITSQFEEDEGLGGAKLAA
jgi:hypothetical protein